MPETWIVLRRAIVRGVLTEWEQPRSRSFATRIAARRWIQKQPRASGEEYRVVRVQPEADPEEESAFCDCTAA